MACRRVVYHTAASLSVETWKRAFLLAPDPAEDIHHRSYVLYFSGAYWCPQRFRTQSSSESFAW